jgi:hypothetical protein
MSDTRTGQERLREAVVRDDSAELTEVSGRRSILATELTLLATCLALFLMWQTVSSLLIVFAGPGNNSEQTSNKGQS